MHVNDFGELNLDFAPPKWKAAPWQLSPSQVSKNGNVTRVPGGDHGSTVKNTFIDQIATPMLHLRRGCQRRARSVPKDMFSRKSEWESACHILGYQNCPVKNGVPRKVILEKGSSELGLNVVIDGDALLVDDIGPGVVESWNTLNADEPISIGDRILEVNDVKGDGHNLLEECKVSKTLVLLVQPSAQTTARSESSVSQTSAASLPQASAMGEMCVKPLETPTWDRCMTGVGYFHHLSEGLQCFSEMGPHVGTDPGWLQASESSDLSLHLGVANAADLSAMPLETPTLDRHVPAMHVSCRAADTSGFVEQCFEQPLVRSWTTSEPTTLAPDTNNLCSVVAPEMSMQDANKFYAVPLAPELSMTLPDVSDFCGIPLETPTLDRYAPAVAVRADCGGIRQGLKLSLADYLQ